MSIKVRGFPSHPTSVVQQALINACRIDAPLRGKLRYLFRVRSRCLVGFKQLRFGSFKIIVAPYAEDQFSVRLSALVPQGPAGPRVRAHDFAGFRPCPRMVSHGSIRTEELNVPQLVTQSKQEAEAHVHVVAGIRQAAPGNKDPSVNGRGNEQLLFRAEALDPGAWARIAQAERGLDGLETSASDGEPCGGAM